MASLWGGLVKLLTCLAHLLGCLANPLDYWANLLGCLGFLLGCLVNHVWLFGDPDGLFGLPVGLFGELVIFVGRRGGCSATLSGLFGQPVRFHFCTVAERAQIKSARASQPPTRASFNHARSSSRLRFDTFLNLVLFKRGAI